MCTRQAHVLQGTMLIGSCCVKLLSVVMQAYGTALAISRLTALLFKAGIITGGHLHLSLRSLLARPSNLRMMAAADLLFQMPQPCLLNYKRPFYHLLRQYCTCGFKGMDAALAAAIMVSFTRVLLCTGQQCWSKWVLQHLMSLLPNCLQRHVNVRSWHPQTLRSTPKLL